MKGIKSYYVAAQVLGISQQSVSAYRKGQIMSDAVAFTLCGMIGTPAAPLLARLAADRADKNKNPGLAKVWKDAAKVLGRKSR